MFRLETYGIVLAQILMANSFLVDILNITTCEKSDFELGELELDLGWADTVDPLLTAKLFLIFDLDKNAYVNYESYVWDEQKWKFLFNGTRSFCNSIVKTITYKRFRMKIQPNWPEKCDVPLGSYTLEKYPISGQYVVLSDLRNVGPLTRHTISLTVEGSLVLCRIVYTISTNHAYIIY